MTEQWLKMAEIYKIFVSDKNNMDFSEKAAQEMFKYESTGKGDLKQGIFIKKGKYNGYAIGKKWMDVTLKMWREDIASGLLAKFELYEDGKYPHWWLDEVLKTVTRTPQGDRDRMLMYA